MIKYIFFALGYAPLKKISAMARAADLGISNVGKLQLDKVTITTENKLTKKEVSDLQETVRNAFEHEGWTDVKVSPGKNQ